MGDVSRILNGTRILSLHRISEISVKTSYLEQLAYTQKVKTSVEAWLVCKMVFVELC